MASGDGQPLLQVPRHEFRVVDDGTRETVEISVQLPGVRSASDISVRIEPPHTVTVEVPLRYALTLPLAVPIASCADVVRFRTKTGKLHMSCRVLTPEEAAAQAAETGAAQCAAPAPQPTAAAAPSGSSSDTAQLVTQSSTISRDGSSAAAAAAAGGDTAGGGSSSGTQQQQQQPAADVLQSFLPPPTKAERRRMEQEEQRRQQEAEQRQREEEAAAAAEAERQRAAEAAAAARRAAEQKRREEAARKAAAKAAAAEEAQRREQQRRMNKAAAEEWLSRGHAAIAQEDIPGVTKALNKAKELDPANTTGTAKLNKELAALRQKAAAAAAAAAGGRRGSSSSPGPGDSSGGNGRQQQQQQQQQQEQDKKQQQQTPYWEQRRAARHGVKDKWVQDMLDSFSAGVHTPGPVGLWCHWVHLLCYWVMWAGQVAIEWAESVPPSRVRCGAAGRSLLVAVAAGGRGLTLAAPMSLILWREAWRQPLAVIAYVRRVGGDSHLEAAEWRADWEERLSSNEDVVGGLTKLALAGSTGGTVYAAFWATCRLSFGPHSLLGWAWALMGWVWRVVAWDPSYALQMVAAGAGTGFCSVARPGPCWLTLYPLQVLLSDRGWGTLLSLGASILYSSTVADWRPSWRQQQYTAPWWQAVLVTVVPTLVVRSISRLGIGWFFLLPVRLVASLGVTLHPALGRLLLGLVRVPLAYGLGAVVVVAPSVAAAVWPGWALRAGASVVCSVNTTRYPAAACSHLTTAAAAHASLPPYPHGFVWDVGLFLWMFYVISVITDWEDHFGKEYYSQQRRERQSQQQQQQRRQQQQRQPGSDDEAEHNSLGDKQSDFPMGFGAVAVPKGCEVASVRAVLEATDYYKVMGYSSREEVTADSLKTKRRQLVLAVHPDKVGHDHPGANQAAGRVNKAYETLSDPSMRSAYDSILANHSRGSGRRAAAAAGGSSSSGGGAGGGWVQEYSDELFERPPAEDKFMCQDMGCPGCGGHHTTYILPKAPFGVRWCAECKDWHPVGKGEVWAHWSPGPLGMSWLGGARLLLCTDPDGPTYDVTELFRCNEAAGILPKDRSRCNTHFNPFIAASSGYGGGGGRSGGGSSGTPRRSRKKGRRH